MKVHASLAATLLDHGVRTMFGVIGDGNMYFVDSFMHDRGGTYVAAANEMGSVLMAGGFASASREVGVATVTYGPGLANALSALMSAARERAPIVVVVGDVPAADRGHAQNVDQACMVAPTGAGFESATSAATVPAGLARALRRAAVERRPIVFNVPSDYMFEDSDYSQRTTVPVSPTQATKPDDAAMDIALGIIASSRRPIVLAGAGCISDGVASALVRLAERLGAPMVTTLPAKGLFAGHKYDLGIAGTFSTPRAVEALLAADCIIAVGASLNQYTAGGPSWPLFDGKRLVHCDVDAEALGRETPTHAPVVADGAQFADTVRAWLDEAEHEPTTFRDWAMALDISNDDAAGSAAPSTGRPGLAAAMSVLNDALPLERSVVVDGGRFMGEAVKRLEVPGPRSWSFPGRGLGAIGNGLATAIGVGCALPDAPVVAVVGDGGFMLGGLAEFNTAVRHGIDLIVVVCNDGSYGAEYAKLQDRGLSIEACLFEWPDFAPVAEALGGSGYTIESSADLTKLESVIAQRGRPLLVDLKLDAASVERSLYAG
jgi:thiamine pyrophosphate-dependent acetolactate synthase large subunit-like protein